MEVNKLDVYYSSHHNWHWVIEEAITKLQQEIIPGINIHYCPSFAKLPSKQEFPSLKPKYSLFRFDVVDQTSLCGMIRVDSLSMSFLDPKDVLYHELQRVQLEKYMPPSELIPWTVDNLEDLPVSFPSTPALLKAPLGSGGSGLYFIHTKEDILEIIKQHRLKALQTPGFLNSVSQYYESSIVPKNVKERNSEELTTKELLDYVPLYWSLQQIIQPIRTSLSFEPQLTVDSPRKTQIRAYLVECQQKFYLFHRLEVRVPHWDVSLDELLHDEDNIHSTNQPKSDQYEEYVCGNSTARPYNESRNKKETRRYLLSEIPELQAYEQTMLLHVQECFQGLKPRLLARVSSLSSSDSASSLPIIKEKSISMAILGIDLLFSEDKNTYIVEVNNNPAMPSKVKHHMSSAYHNHLIELNASMYNLALSNISSVVPKLNQVKHQEYLTRFIEI